MPGKILIIDQDQEAQKRVVPLLEKEGHQVIIAANGIEGLKKADEESPDLVILELLLPGLDGYEVCHRLRTQTSQLPIVILSARNGDKARAAGLKVGADDYLAKSGEPAELLVTVNRLLAQKKISPKAVGSARRFAFLGTRGGVGTTTIAINVAVALSQEKKRVALVDLCPSISVCPVYQAMGLRGEAEHDYLPAVKPPERDFSSALETHESGVKILTYSSLTRHCYGEPSPEDISALAEELGPQHDCIVIDIPPYSSALKRALLKCNRAIMVTASVPNALSIVKSMSDLLNRLGLAKERLAMVINDKGGTLSGVASSMEPVLTSVTDIELLGVVPHSSRAQEWEAKGIPIVIAEPDCPTSLALQGLARRLIEG